MRFSLEYRNSMKKTAQKFGRVILSLTVTGLLFGGMSLSSYAAPKIQYGTYTVKGKSVKLALADIRVDSVKLTAGKGEVPPIILNSRTLVPVKMLSEKLGATVAWNAKTEEATLNRGDKKIVLKIGSPTATVNGVKKVLPDQVAPMIVDSRTMLPVKFLADEYSLKIAYDAKSNSVDLSSSGDVAVERPLTQEEQQKILGSIDNSATTPPPTDNPVFNETPAPPVVVPPVVAPPVAPTTPTTPVSPVIPEKITPPATNQNQPENSKNLKEVSYGLVQNSLDNERFVIKGGASLSYQNFYLSSPERLVIDIQKAYVNPTLDQNMLYSSSSFLTQMNSFYYSGEDRLRMTLTLRGDVSRNEITIGKNSEDIVVEYKSSKPLNSNLKFDSDRITATLDLKLISSYVVSDITEDPFSNSIQFTVPFDKGNLKDEVRNLNNNLVSKIQVTKNDNTSKVTLSLKDRVGYTLIDNGGSSKLSLLLKKEQRQTPLLVIDPGHGAKDPGAIGKTGMTEKELNLIIGRKLNDRLSREGFQVLMTRDSDTYPELKGRSALANSNEADIFISIHHNSGGNSSANGIETLYYPTQDNKDLAQVMHVEILNASGAADRKIIKRPDLVVLNTTKVPAVLLELGYMSNPSELSKISSDAYQNQLVDGIVNGIKAYINAY